MKIKRRFKIAAALLVETCCCCYAVTCSYYDAMQAEADFMAWRNRLSKTESAYFDLAIGEAPVMRTYGMNSPNWGGGTIWLPPPPPDSPPSPGERFGHYPQQHDPIFGP